ncbi:diguanylate cyclase [Novosphingobium album (ex Hu et al. 2023)]|uniref:Diguanylate cyclase n=1 Tax=Novosphingobium album (ex Hu et al. 2023) TaxID=2930093 RepID=A0ABT0B333_9SPHN|nr:diguanylate cyclase [Novosphingobium album (ex Hu et al. 2023)]MCJ2179466.1 diguanylate cyclase [Novosphingobium album (ex Hu et al. 2023)]
MAFDHNVKPEAKFEASFGAEVDQAFDLIRNGKQAKAVGLFDKVIASADQSLAGDSRTRVCRSDRTARSADPSHVVLVDGALCDAHFGKGYALIDLGRGDLAEGELRMAMQMAPGNAHFANEYAELFKSRREWQQSYDAFAHAWAVADKDKTGPDADLAARALRGMGYNKMQMGDLDEAAQLFRQSQDYEPGSEAAKIELSNIARKQAIGS